jgi:hypothetical protein
MFAASAPATAELMSAVESCAKASWYPAISASN